MLLIDAETSLREFLSEAETDEDFAAVEELIAENESKRGPRDAGRWVVKTLREVAEALGYANQTVNQWRSEVGMPGEPGAYPIPEIAQWRFAKVRGGDLATAKKQQDLELGTVELETKRMELAKERGELLDRADVELFVAQALIELREVVMSLPDTLGTSAPPELRGFIREESDRLCRGALIALHRRLENMQSEVAESVVA